MRKLLRLLGAGLLLAILAAALYVFVWKPALPAAAVEFTIVEGSGLRAAAIEMQRAGVLAHWTPMVLLGRLTGADTRVQAGHYELRSAVSLWQLLQKVTRGDVTLSAITFVEGWTLRQWRSAIAAHPDLQAELQSQSDGELAAALGIAEGSAEGWLFPDTYLFTKGSTDRALLTRAHRAMNEHLEREWAARPQESPLKTPYEALILASIVEKETGLASDRATIAGVFHNRMRIGMRLQTDPTVIYGMGEAFDGNLRRKDLRTDTPFNTYTRSGLPPTPIAMPGLDSLRAALNPASTRAMYFVSRGDGSSQFSETLAEHNSAVRKYQLGGGKAGR